MERGIGASTRFLVGVVVLSLALSTAALAQSGATEKGKSGQHQVRPPTEEEIQVLLEGMKPQVNQSDEGLTVYELSDGTKAVYLEERFQSVALAKTNSDGSVSTECVSTQKDAEKFLKADSKKEAEKKEAAKKAKPEPAPALEVK